ncbi:aspartate-semialdehyde dehydrogenase [Anaeromyxobacter sp. Red801]|uniref:aspartate-semialdehyde dehydrogenase n=1 Tax=Anaeromyxobacter sp. Red801 TaxID=3411632 RepID=UPI003BA0BF00
MPKPISVALVGATGLVGRAVLDALGESSLPLSRLALLASARSAGTRLEHAGAELPVSAPAEGTFRGVDAAVFCVPPEVAREWAPRAWAEGCAVVDASPAFRLEADVPLVVPEVNGAAVEGFRARGVVASPAGAAAALSVALAPLHAAAGLERVVATTLEPAASAGHRAVQQLEREAMDLMNGREPEPGGAVPHRLAFNLVPQVGAFLEDGRTDAEEGLGAELRKVLGAPGLRVAATAVRVPVFYGQAAVVNAATARALPAEAARDLLRRSPGVKVLDATAEGVYPMPMLAVNDDAVLVGRLRDDRSQAHGLELVVVSDELRKGAATNLVQILERLAALL